MRGRLFSFSSISLENLLRERLEGKGEGARRCLRLCNKPTLCTTTAVGGITGASRPSMPPSAQLMESQTRTLWG